MEGEREEAVAGKPFRKGGAQGSVQPERGYGPVTGSMGLFWGIESDAMWELVGFDIL